MQTEPYLVAQVELVEHGPAYEGKSNSLRAEAAIRQAYELFDRYCELSPKSASAEMLMNIMSSEDPAISPTSSPRMSPCGCWTSSLSWTNCARCSG